MMTTATLTIMQKDLENFRKVLNMHNRTLGRGFTIESEEHHPGVTLFTLSAINPEDFFWLGRDLGLLTEFNTKKS